jgi:hypothetical protein
MRGSILLSEPSLTPGTRRIHVEGVFGSMKNYVTGNIHRGYMQFTARASQHCPDNPLLAEYEQHPLHQPTQWVHGFTVLILEHRAQWEHDWLEQVAEAHDDTADLPAAA